MGGKLRQARRNELKEGRVERELLSSTAAFLSKKMAKEGRTWQAVDLPWEKSSLRVMQIILILAFLCKGLLSQASSFEYTVTVPPSSYVQQGSSLYIPCQFTYDSGHASRWGETISVYWFKIAEGTRHCFDGRPSRCFPGILMATNPQAVDKLTQNRFFGVGDPNQGNCSFLIVDAQPEDEGNYYLRIHGSGWLKYSYSPPKHISPHIMMSGKCFPNWPLSCILEQPRMVRIRKKEDDQHIDLLSPQILQHVVVQEGDSLNLLCEARGKPEPTLTWMKLSTTTKISMDGLLHFSLIKAEDAGEYQCEAENRLGAIKENVTVIVEYAPRTVAFSISQPSTRNPELIHDYSREVANGSQLMAQEGESLRILCNAESYPPVSASWTKPDGKNWPNSTLEVTDLTVKDEGWYACRAANGRGSVQGSFHLCVAYAPRLSRSPRRNSTCWPQDNGFLCFCSLQAHPRLIIQWEVDGEAVTGHSSRKNHHITALVEGNEVTSSINWTGSRQVDHTIACLGRNAFGVFAKQFLLSASTVASSYSTENQKAVVVSGLCGVLLTASLFLIGLFLFTFYKRRKMPSNPGNFEAVEPVHAEPQKATNMSLIYSNILPLGRRTPHIGQFKAAEEKIPKRGPIRTAPTPAPDEIEDLHYASLDFDPKKRGKPVPEEDSVDYSEVKPK
uniref:Sialic acid-binding Ig-like lectin 5 n=1 Tax=Pogona vitticeps TaxID=103695 RepID=A0ABM5ESF8_9SAUR